MRPLLFLICLLWLASYVQAQNNDEIPTLSPYEHSSLFSVPNRGQPIECKREYETCPKGELEITHILFKRYEWTAVARCLHLHPNGTREVLYINIRWLKGLPSVYSLGSLGVSAWYRKSFGIQIRPEFQISHITYIAGTGLVARCHYRRDEGIYAKAHMKLYFVPDWENYATRTVSLKWLTFNLASEEGDYETDNIRGNNNNSLR